MSGALSREQVAARERWQARWNLPILADALAQLFNLGGPEADEGAATPEPAEPARLHEELAALPELAERARMEVRPP